MKAEPGPEGHIFWGKFQKKDGVSLSLKAHCLDVALTFHALSGLPGFRRTLEAAAGRELSDRDLDRLSVLAMLHDVGKANLGFQMKVFERGTRGAGHVKEIEAVFDDEKLCARFTKVLRLDVIGGWFDEETVLDSYFLAAWSHHGNPIRFQGNASGSFLTAKNKWWRAQGHWDPMQEIAEIMKWAEQAFPAAFRGRGPCLPGNPRFHHRFAGLLMLADWLGSHPDWFPIEPTDLRARLRQDLEALPRLLEAVGLDVAGFRPVLAGRDGTFESRFGFPPRPLQALVDDLDTQGNGARLILAESETGSGKTEASFHWFCRLFEAGEVDSLYFALPTRVAAREIYRRIDTYTKKFFPDPARRPVTVLAVPGYPRVDGLAPHRILPGEETRWTDERDKQKRERQWAAERPKRFLAAAVAVGTVDQALLSSVQTSHAHLRSVCLDRSLLVVDEVHASDTYMGRLLSFLISHHLSTGGRAMLLSATLGSRARTHFLEAAGKKSDQPDPEESRRVPYPSVTLGDGRCLAPPANGKKRARRVTFERVPHALEPENLIPDLLMALRAGARVLVIMNTVKRACDLLRAVERSPGIESGCLFTCRGVVCPHHGRFAPVDRELLDRAVSDAMGEDAPPGPRLLIGTQTLEQSLDIDADLMITDICPADVLLQRVGRLHRHDRERPPCFQNARCRVLVPREDSLESALTDNGETGGVFKGLGYGSVYEDMRILELTLRAIRNCPAIKIPRDCRWLVEEATHPERLGSLTGEKWALHAEGLEGKRIMQELAAVSAAAVYDQYFGEFVFNEAGERVVTRLGADSLRLPLDKEVTSPFGERLDEIVIPGHMKPGHAEESVEVVSEKPGEIRLRNADRRYIYTRYGLEEEK